MVQTSLTPNTLYVVATPIGNLGDISIRALDTLKGVDLIISEDTRQTSKLLKHYDIKNAQTVYTDEKHAYNIPKILGFIKSGKSAALVSDRGTPLISDPGYKLIHEALSQGITVLSVPGPSALVAALSISGLPTDKFTFVGFLPKKGGDRAETIKKFGDLDATLVIYEAPYRVLKTLEDLYNTLGDRVCCVVKEITKLHESTFYGKLSELLKLIPTTTIKGEYVILVSKEGFLL